MIIPFIIALVIVLLIAGAALAVVRAALATPALAWLGPYGNLIYALIVLLVVLMAVQHFYPAFRF